MKFLIILVVIVFAGSGESLSYDRECADLFLTSNGNVSAGRCFRIIRQQTTEFQDDIKSRMSADDDKPCILKVLDDYDVVDLYLRGRALHTLGRSASQSGYEDDVDESKDALMKAAKALCVADNKHSEEFNDYFSKRDSSTEISHEDACATKYLVDNNVIDPQEYNIPSSTLNVGNCNSVFEELRETFSEVKDEDSAANTFFGLSAVKAQDCSTKKFKDGKIFEKLFSFPLIIRYNLTQPQINKLKSDYTIWMTSSVRFLLECLKEI